MLSRAVPVQQCRALPGVECFLVLKTVPDLDCQPESHEDCRDVVVEEPRLEQEEECEEVAFEKCFDIEEQVPIQVMPFIHIGAPIRNSLYYLFI